MSKNKAVIILDKLKWFFFFLKDAVYTVPDRLSAMDAGVKHMRATAKVGDPSLTAGDSRVGDGYVEFCDSKELDQADGKAVQ